MSWDVCLQRWTRSPGRCGQKEALLLNRLRMLRAGPRVVSEYDGLLDEIEAYLEKDSKEVWR